MQQILDSIAHEQINNGNPASCRKFCQAIIDQLNNNIEKFSNDKEDPSSDNEIIDMYIYRFRNYLTFMLLIMKDLENSSLEDFDLSSKKLAVQVTMIERCTNEFKAYVSERDNLLRKARNLKAKLLKGKK